MSTIEHIKRWRENRNQNDETHDQKNPYQKFLEKNTRKTAIDAFCMQCMGTSDPDAPQAGYRRDIKECTAPACPLYNWRPYQ